MKTTIHEFAGVMLSVCSTPAPAGDLPTVNSVRVLGSDYKPCGPDLTPLLDVLTIATSVDITGSVIELSPFLSVVTAEIEYVKC